MAFHELKKDLMEADANMRSYLEHSEEYARLKAFKVLMRMITESAQVLLVGALAFLALLFLSLSASYALGKALNDTFYGFLIIGGAYVIVGLLGYFFRHWLEKPLLRKFSKHYFD